MSTESTNALREERDMYRDKAHRAIGSLGRWETLYARLWVEHQSLVDALGDLTEVAEQRAIMTVGASELRFLSEEHYREDGPNGETTGCHCALGVDHDLAAMDTLYNADGEREWTSPAGPPGPPTRWLRAAAEELAAKQQLATQMDGAYRPCAGCDSVGASCRAVECPATRAATARDEEML